MLKVLIAEDDLMIADMVEETLVMNGYDVCGIARTVPEGIALGLLHEPDLAVLDLRLAEGGLSTEIAAQLVAHQKIGILYATGNMSHVLLTSADGNACLAKPYSAQDLLQGLEIVTDIMNKGTSLKDFPAGFQILKRKPRVMVAS
jgi:DNA-binding response OmpR family regulator